MNRKRMFLIVCCGVLFSCLIGSSIQAKGVVEEEYKYFKSIEVQKGDSLWTIAEEYMKDDYDTIQDYITEVQLINSIKGEQITEGCSIVIPYYDTDLH